jgi:16S rRNA processing protein RimM
MQLAVGRIVRPHGILGEVTVEVRTDDPGERFADGQVLVTDPPEVGPLTVESVRWHTGRLLVTFAGISDRDQAESLRGTWLTVDSADLPAPADPDEFRDADLIGLRVVTTTGEPVGTVRDVQHHGQDRLVIEPAAADGSSDLLVPFVAAIAVEVDVPAGRLVIDPPPGLLDLEAGPPGRE